MRSNFWRRLFSFPAMLMAILFASPFFASLDVQRGGPVMRDPDIWWHLRNAQILLSTHHFIRQDLYSFTTSGQPWINPEWLAEIPYYFGFRLFGERGIFLVMLAAVELFIAGMLVRCYLRSRDISSAFLATWIAVLLAAVNIGPRTILFGWLCFLGEMFVLEAFRRGRDHLWLLIPIYALWINLHGSWLIGYAFFVLFVASGTAGGTWGSIEAVKWTPAQLKKLMAVGAASVAALFVNPYGWRLVAYPFNMLLHQRLNLAVVDEWRSVSFQSFYGVVVFVLASAMLVFTLARRRSWPLYELLFALLAVYVGLSHKRFLFLIGMIVCPMMTVELAGLVFAPYDAKKDNKQVLNVVLMAGFLFFAIRHVPTSAKLHVAEAEYFPVKALPALENSCSGEHTLNQYEWGGFLIWHARGTPVFVDSRTDIFEYYGVLADYLKAANMDDSLAILDRYRVGCVLLSPGSQLVYLLQHTPGWRTQYEDGTATLLVRAR
ncbi:MAG: hypothetical protein WA400_07160 [Silvibacterium sp.]